MYLTTHTHTKYNKIFKSNRLFEYGKSQHPPPRKVVEEKQLRFYVIYIMFELYNLFLYTEYK